MIHLRGRDCASMIHRCNLCQRCSRVNKSHGSAILVKLRAINIYNVQQRLHCYYHNSFLFQTLTWKFKIQCLTSRNHYIAELTMSIFVAATDLLKAPKTRLNALQRLQNESLHEFSLKIQNSSSCALINACHQVKFQKK